MGTEGIDLCVPRQRIFFLSPVPTLLIMRPGAFFLVHFLGSSLGMSTLNPSVDVSEITSTEMTTEMTSVDKEEGSGKIFYLRMMFIIQTIQQCKCF